jgi:tRNA pseudouridine32 synthase/23S rRNA pseudouridine746 synthase
MIFIFRNSDFVIVDKLAGVLSTPARTGASDPRPCLGLQLQEKLQAQIFPVHRLDFEVSGLLLFAMNPQAHAQANFWFENRLVKKTYEAWTEGEPDSGWKPGESFIWKNQLLRGKKRAYVSPAGKWSQTNAQWKGWKNERMWWELEPVTGRPHQLRAHLSQNGFPILGDALYGAQEPYKPNAIALRAFRLDFSAIPAESRRGLADVVEVEGL